MKRRPHWTDDLIEAVSDATENNAYHDEMVYAVIAAVEDWQERHPEPYIEADTDSLHKAKAALQRGREAATIRPYNLYSDPYYSGYVHACGNILRALEGAE